MVSDGKMKNSEKNLTIFRYLMTIARRDGADNIGIRLIISDGTSVALLKIGGNRHILPYKNIDSDAEGDELRDAVLYAVEDLGLYISAVGRYLGSREFNNGSSLTKYIHFEVFVKKKSMKNLKWMKSSDVGKLNLPMDERRILKSYFKHI